MIGHEFNKATRACSCGWKVSPTKMIHQEQQWSDHLREMQDLEYQVARVFSELRKAEERNLRRQSVKYTEVPLAHDLHICQQCFAVVHYSVAFEHATWHVEKGHLD